MVAKPFVKIIWHDAEDFQESGWASGEALENWNAKPCESFSYGYLASKNKHYVTICADLIHPDTFGRCMKIPRRMIQEITEIDLSTSMPLSPRQPRKRKPKPSFTEHQPSPTAGARAGEVQDSDPNS